MTYLAFQSYIWCLCLENFLFFPVDLTVNYREGLQIPMYTCSSILWLEVIMVLFLFLSNILYFYNRFYFAITLQDIDNCLGDSILLGSVYKMMGVEPLFRFIYFQVVTSILSQIRSCSVSCYMWLYVCSTFFAVVGTVLPHLLMGKNVPERMYQHRI